MMNPFDMTAGYSDSDVRDMQRQISVEPSTQPRRKCTRCRCVVRIVNNHRRMCSPCIEAKLGTYLIGSPVTLSHSSEILTGEIVDKFWRLTQRNGKRACWGWKGYISAQGYATFAVKRRILYACRVVYQIATGAFPPSFLYNTCGNDGCTNPAHIAQGRKQG